MNSRAMTVFEREQHSTWNVCRPAFSRDAESESKFINSLQILHPFNFYIKKSTQLIYLTRTNLWGSTRRPNSLIDQYKRNLRINVRQTYMDIFWSRLCYAVCWALSSLCQSLCYRKLQNYCALHYVFFPVWGLVLLHIPARRALYWLMWLSGTINPCWQIRYFLLLV